MSLKGKRVLVTRADTNASAMVDLLHQAGAEAVVAPTIEFVPPEDPAALDAAIEAARDGRFAWVVFATPRAVEAVASRMEALGVRPPLPLRAAGIGPSTVAAMESAGLPADLVPDTEYSAAGLIEAFPMGEGDVLLPRADIAPADLEDGLAEHGWTPVRVAAYRTRHPETLPEEARAMLDAGIVDAVAFTSASTARGFARLAGRPAKPRYACIGPVTAKAAREAGFTVDVIAVPHTIEGLIAALDGLFGEAPGDGAAEG